MRADIFCKRVDNYGDIGVCWRLARRLAHGAGWDIRLWVDDLTAFSRLEPGIDPARAEQTILGIGIVAWTADAPALAPADVVIEAFACDPPPAFRTAMQSRRPLWLNLEYLSAEAWVESCHGLPSPQPDGLPKYFFFPGFTPATGGLLREPGLTRTRDAFQQSRGDQRAFLSGLGLSEDDLACWDKYARVVTLFSYAQSPAATLPPALGLAGGPTLLLVPEGIAPDLHPPCGGNVRLARVPFLPQDQYDRLLWCGDLNFVRGEDSFVRAAWAARPLVWQIYPQQEMAHLEKLDAWLDRYDPPGPARALTRAWNDTPAPRSFSALLQDALAPAAWQAWQTRARRWDAEYANRPDLADNLVAFCAKQAEKG